MKDALLIILYHSILLIFDCLHDITLCCYVCTPKKKSKEKRLEEEGGDEGNGNKRG